MFRWYHSVSSPLGATSSNQKNVKANLFQKGSIKLQVQPLYLQPPTQPSHVPSQARCRSPKHRSDSHRFAIFLKEPSDTAPPAAERRNVVGNAMRGLVHLFETLLCFLSCSDSVAARHTRFKPYLHLCWWTHKEFHADGICTWLLCILLIGFWNRTKGILHF